MTATVAVRTNGLGVLMYERTFHISLRPRHSAHRWNPIHIAANCTPLHTPSTRSGWLHPFARDFSYRGFVVYTTASSRSSTPWTDSDFDIASSAIQPCVAMNYLTKPEYGIVDGSISGNQAGTFTSWIGGSLEGKRGLPPWPCRRTCRGHHEGLRSGCAAVGFLASLCTLHASKVGSALPGGTARCRYGAGPRMTDAGRIRTRQVHQEQGEQLYGT